MQRVHAKRVDAACAKDWFNDVGYWTADGCVVFCPGAGGRYPRGGVAGRAPGGLLEYFARTAALTCSAAFASASGSKSILPMRRCW